MKHFINNPLFASTLLNLKQAEEAQHNETAIPFHREYPRPPTHRGFPTTSPLSQSWNEQPLEKGRYCTWALLFFPKGELVLMPNLNNGSSRVFFTLYQIIHVSNRLECPFCGKRERTRGSDTGSQTQSSCTAGGSGHSQKSPQQKPACTYLSKGQATSVVLHGQHGITARPSW